MEKRLTELQQTGMGSIQHCQNLEDLESLRIKYLGKRGFLAEITKELGKVPPAKRRPLGKLLNQTKKEIQTAYKKRVSQLKAPRPRRGEAEGGQSPQPESERLDATHPEARPVRGHLHLITQAIEEITAIFERIGFSRVRYPEIELDYYAFEALNMPKNHPARDELETFFLTDKMVITPHTSSGQIREMEKGQLPIRMINVARCGRRQSDISHVPTFYQFEGLLVDKDVSIGHLKGVIDYFVKQFYGPNRTIRLRPYDFRFTEPSFEIDVTCGLCNGRGCHYCRGGWAELGGAGMVHPNVLKAGGIDPEQYSGFAFGWGVERTYLMKSGTNINDIRIIYQNDFRFLEQF
ncbi:phenylalanine--tRNA ligase subunit alpha [Candidatus Parcubacteria bacterium]|nr:phenylalanine--tRNA ligase subunit alpha [Candidatus Parcubacteria bacterium]